VAAICANAAVEGAYLNVRINLPSIKDKSYIDAILNRAMQTKNESNTLLKEVLDRVNGLL